MNEQIIAIIIVLGLAVATLIKYRYELKKYFGEFGKQAGQQAFSFAGMIIGLAALIIGFINREASSSQRKI